MTQFDPGICFFQQEQPVVEAFFECTFARFELNARRERQENQLPRDTVVYIIVTYHLLYSFLDFNIRADHLTGQFHKDLQPNRSPGQMRKPMRPQPGVGHPLHGGFSMRIPFNKALHLPKF